MRALMRRIVATARERNAQRRTRSHGLDSVDWVTCRADEVRIGDTILVAAIATALVNRVVPTAHLPGHDDPWLLKHGILPDLRPVVEIHGRVGEQKYFQRFDPDRPVRVIRG